MGSSNRRWTTDEVHRLVMLISQDEVYQRVMVGAPPPRAGSGVPAPSKMKVSEEIAHKLDPRNPRNGPAIVLKVYRLRRTYAAHDSQVGAARPRGDVRTLEEMDDPNDPVRKRRAIVLRLCPWFDTWLRMKRRWESAQPCSLAPVRTSPDMHAPIPPGTSVHADPQTCSHDQKDQNPAQRADGQRAGTTAITAATSTASTSVSSCTLAHHGVGTNTTPATLSMIQTHQHSSLQQGDLADARTLMQPYARRCEEAQRETQDSLQQKDPAGEPHTGEHRLEVVSHFEQQSSKRRSEERGRRQREESQPKPSDRENDHELRRLELAERKAARKAKEAHQERMHELLQTQIRQQQETMQFLLHTFAQPAKGKDE